MSKQIFWIKFPIYCIDLTPEAIEKNGPYRMAGLVWDLVETDCINLIILWSRSEAPQICFVSLSSKFNSGWPHYCAPSCKLCTKFCWLCSHAIDTLCLIKCVDVGTRNIPEHSGTFRNIPEHPGTFGNILEHSGTSRNMKKLK